MMRLYFAALMVSFSPVAFAQSSPNYNSRIHGIPAGYYTAAAGLDCASLKTALMTIVSAGYNHQTYTPGIWNAFATTDTRPSPNNTTMWDMYSDIPGGVPPYTYTYSTNQCGSYNSEADCYNREHSVPASWFSDNYPMYTDLHHLFATDGYVNNIHNNYLYAKVGSTTYVSQNGSKRGSSVTPGISGTVFEPLDSFKGDFARAFLYMITRYESGVGFPVTSWTSGVAGGTGINIFTGNTYPSINTAYIDLMYSWHVLDPVSQKEIDRNDAVYAIQNNRNPYVDSPQFVQRVFSCASATFPVQLVYFTGNISDDRIKIRWKMENEDDVISYSLERSEDAALFHEVYFRLPVLQPEYNWEDLNVPASKTFYYRLVITERSGKKYFSPVIHFGLSDSWKDYVVIHPNPAAAFINIEFKKNLRGKALFELFDLNGKRLMQQFFVPVANRFNMDLEGKLPAGQYLVRISNDRESVTRKVLIIQ